MSRMHLVTLILIVAVAALQSEAIKFRHSQHTLSEDVPEDFTTSITQACEENTACVITGGKTVLMDASITLKSLLIEKGSTLDWDTSKDGLVLKAGWILVMDDNSKFLIGRSDAPMLLKATIYILNNNAPLPKLAMNHANHGHGNGADAMAGCTFMQGGRFFGSLGTRFRQTQEERDAGPSIQLFGKPLKKTWSLLTKDAFNTNSLTVKDNVEEWLPGDEVAIAPTYMAFWEAKQAPYGFRSEITSVTGKQSNQISMKDTIEKGPKFREAFLGRADTGYQAEVILLTRNIRITGDDFSLSKHPNAAKRSEIPDQGLTTFAAHSGFQIMDGVQIDTCGARGYMGKYCVHLHLLDICPKCLIRNVAVVESWQRGLNVHGTHNSTLSNNVLYNVRGAGIYIEDGNEFHTKILNNVVVCGIGGSHQVNKAELNFDTQGPCESYRGTDIPGCKISLTDNLGSDCLQQAGIWMSTATQELVGNRIANNYNGIYIQTSAVQWGKVGGDVEMQVAVMSSPFGKYDGNVCHSCQRFGWYPDANWPRNEKLGRNLHRFGGNLEHTVYGVVMDLAVPNNPNAALPNPVFSGNVFRYAPDVCISPRTFLCDGTDNGQTKNPFTGEEVPARISNGFEYGNQYVGQYDLGDVQYYNFYSVNSKNSMYWKQTKNFAVIGTEHILDSYFGYFDTPMLGPKIADDVIMSLPGGTWTMIIRNVKIAGSSLLGAIGTNQQAINPGGRWPWDKEKQAYVLAGPDEAVGNPVYHFINLDLSAYKANNVKNQRVLIHWGSESGNPHGSVITTFDSAAQFGGKKGVPRSVVPAANAHLLAFDSCKRSTGEWAVALENGIVCDGKVGGRVRRLDIWLDTSNTNIDMNKTFLAIRSASEPFETENKFEIKMSRKVGPPSLGDEKNNVRTFSVPILVGQKYIITYLDGSEIDQTVLDAIEAIEFSDLVYSPKNTIQKDNAFREIEEATLTMAGKTCVMKSDHDRRFLGTWGLLNKEYRKKTGTCLEMFA